MHGEPPRRNITLAMWLMSSLQRLLLCSHAGHNEDRQDHRVHQDPRALQVGPRVRQDHRMAPQDLQAPQADTRPTLAPETHQIIGKSGATMTSTRTTLQSFPTQAWSESTGST